MAAAEAAELSPEKLIVRPRPEVVEELVGRSLDERRKVFGAAAAARTGDVKRTRTLRLSELSLAELPIEGSTISTTKNGNQPRSELQIDAGFWHVLACTWLKAASRSTKSSGAFILVARSIWLTPLLPTGDARTSSRGLTRPLRLGR
jgi:hypothetical protein